MHNKTHNNDAGFSHLIIILGVAVIAIVGVAGTFVMHHHNDASRSVQTNKKTALLTPTASADAQTKASANPVTATADPASPPPAATPSPTTPAPSPSPASTQTVLSTLTTLITNLKAGIDAQVTASAVTIPGPISTATGRPLVFTFSGQTYFAYTQTNAPDFSGTAVQTAGSMAIVKATVANPALINAHLDKVNSLVDANFTSVGYSSGGN